MPIALKELSPSDLTFFEPLFRRLNVGNQKSINLNADCFTGQLYPSLAGFGIGQALEIPMHILVLGPGMAGPYRVLRSVTKGATYKNWRLNGSAVPNPDDEPGRFDGLQPGDIAVMEFTGELRPEALTLILVSATDDPALHAALAARIPGRPRTMVQIEPDDLAALADQGGAVAGHPIGSILVDPLVEADLEEAVLGSAPATRRLRRRRGRPITTEDLERARANNERVGRAGEAWALIHLNLQVATGELLSVTWMAQTDAGAPWDFQVVTAAGETVRIDAKSTEGSFGQRIHISAGELDAAAYDGGRYDIMRVYDMDQDRAHIRVAANIGTFARSVVDGLQLPAGVEPDSYSIDPSALTTWGPEETVERPDAPE